MDATTEPTIGGATAAVAEAPQGLIPEPPTMQAVESQPAVVVPTTENVLDQATAVVAGAEAVGGTLPTYGLQPPVAEMPPVATGGLI